LKLSLFLIFLIEKTKFLGLVLVSACWTDLGDANERASGYYNRPWEWQAMKENVKLRYQFASKDDPFIPFSEMQHVAEQLETEFKVFQKRGHFCSSEFLELHDLVVKTFEQ
jgi:predicted alpha/beta hydrolase family esterase